MSSITTDIGAGLETATEAEKITEQLNTPEMIEARRNVAMQKAKDKINSDAAQALKTGDVTEINKDLQ